MTGRGRGKGKRKGKWKGKGKGKGTGKDLGDYSVDGTVVPPSYGALGGDSVDDIVVTTSYEPPASETFREEVGRSTVVLPSYEPRASKNRREGIGIQLDIVDLLFTVERDFLVKNNDEKVLIADLKGRTIVLFIFPLHPAHLWGVDHPDMIDAYNQMLCKGRDVEFVLVPVEPDNPVHFPTPAELPLPSFRCSKDIFDYLFSTIPFPSIPFSDVQACGGRVRATLQPRFLPYWMVIDPNHNVITTGLFHDNLFRLFGGDELYPLTPEAIEACHRSTSIKEHISKWDQLLVSPGRSFLLSGNGDKVPVDSLKGKVIGLYFCDNVPDPPRMELIKKVYWELKYRNSPFQIVQINFHYHFFGTRNVGTNPTAEPFLEDISWLRLPFKDPSCRKLQRIFTCDHDDYWPEDCLVIVNTLQDDVQFELSGAEMFQAYGAAAYPFTRYSLYDTEYCRQKRELKLDSLFPPAERLLRRSGKVDVSYLSGKRVLVLFADQSITNAGAQFLSMLESKYVNKEAAEEDKFEVVYISTDQSQSSFDEYRRHMRWLVHPYSVDFASACARKIFNAFDWSMVAVAAFEENGELIAKHDDLGCHGEWGLENHQFPFISHDLKTTIRAEVQVRCDLFRYCRYESDDEALVS